MSLSKCHILRNTSTLLLLLSFSILSSYSVAGTLPESHNVQNEFMDQKALFAAITTRKNDLSNESHVTTAILEKIKRNITLPTATPESTTTLYFKLDEKGNVLSVKALSASPLPIDLNKPDSFRDLVIKINVTRACPHFKNGDKNEINCSQTRKIAQIISRY